MNDVVQFDLPIAGELSHNATAGVPGCTGEWQIGPQSADCLHLLTPGTFDFHCSIHPQMTGQLVVNP